jgi:hypothetical protein
MRFVLEYRRFACEYRKLLQQLTRPRDKGALELMARAWDKIAMDRERRLLSLSLPPDVRRSAQGRLYSIRAKETFDCYSCSYRVFRRSPLESPKM